MRSVFLEAVAPTFLVPIASTAPKSVDENSPKDTSILTVEGQDGDGDTLTFSISTQNPMSPPFELDSATGLFKTPNGLDAETTQSFVFTFGVSDGTTTVDSVPFTVNINDLNDNTPQFVGAPYSASLLDSVGDGTSVVNVTATDADITPTTIRYSIAGGNTGTTFAIDTNGQITVATSSNLNGAVTPTYTLTVQASDGTNTGSATVTVTVREDFCTPSPCQNSGTCTLSGDTCNCSCTGGFIGQNCTQVDYCYGDPCVNGNCINGNTNYTCNCTPGYIGTNCATVDYCFGDPCVNGVCINGNTRYTCNCSGEYIGVNCSQVNYCYGGPCKNGVCINGKTNYTCNCTAGFRGVNCSKGKSGEPSFLIPTASTAPRSVDENSAKDVSILTVEGQDPDRVTLTFSIVTQYPFWPPFNLDSVSGLFTAPSGLDAEKSQSFFFIFGVSDGKTTVQSVPFTVKINDVNEFAPRFTLAKYSAILMDSAGDGASVVSVLATDADVTAVVTYSIKAGNIGSTFAIDPYNGHITLARSYNLNVARILSYSLLVQAHDGLHTDTTTVNITVNKKSIAPTFLVPTLSTKRRSVYENSAKDVSILTVEGQDEDGAVLSFSIVTQKPISPPFEMDSATGLFRTPSGLDAETSQTYVFTFGVSDGTTTVQSVPFIVNINDFNEFAPQFAQATYSATLMDSESNGASVIKVFATDLDVKAVVTYSITDGNNGDTFAIDTYDGYITLARSYNLNVAIVPIYSLTVQASDGTYTNTTTVVITVNGKSEAPIFLVPTASTAPRSVNENSPKDVSILTVEGQDRDGDTLTFSILTQNPASPSFELDSTTGLFETTSGLDAETCQTYVFTFGVSDGRTTVQSVPFTVNIRDLNEYGPRFLQTKYSSTLMDSANDGKSVVNVLATDADVTANITYSILAGNTGSTFAIDTNSGHITVEKSSNLNVATTPTYTLTVQASDGTNTATAIVIITVNCKG